MDKIVIRGDSALIINFLNKKNVPKKKTLVKKILEARRLITQLKGLKCLFQHVDRSENRWADWLSKQAIKLKRDSEMLKKKLHKDWGTKQS